MGCNGLYMFHLPPEPSSNCDAVTLTALLWLKRLASPPSYSSKGNSFRSPGSKDESECCLCAPRRLSETLCGGPKSLWDHHRESQPSFQCIRKSPSALQGTGKPVIYTIAIAIWFICSSQNYPSQISLMVPTVGPGVGEVLLFRPSYPKLK